MSLSLATPLDQLDHSKLESRVHIDQLKQAFRTVRTRLLSIKKMFSPIRKNKSGSIIHSGERRVIYNVFKYFNKCVDQNEIVDSIVVKTASACGVSENTVYKIIKEQKEIITQISQQKKRVRLSTIDKFDDLDKCSIRRKVHSLYLKNEYPTLDKIMSLCHDDSDIPTFQRTTLHKIFHELGFDFAKRESRSLLLERDDIVLWRRNI